MDRFVENLMVNEDFLELMELLGIPRPPPALLGLRPNSRRETVPGGGDRVQRLAGRHLRRRERYADRYGLTEHPGCSCLHP